MNEELKIYKLADLEKMLGLTRVTLLKYCNNGELKAVKVGRNWAVTEANLKAYLNRETPLKK